MNYEITEKDIEWADEQVKKYSELISTYRDYKDVIEKILESIKNKYAPDGIVQVREKSLASFAGKIWRKREIANPVDQFTDLCGGRIITNDLDQVRAVCTAIVKNFEIDWVNSTDIEQRLKPSEFGYRSIHYIVLFRRGVFPIEEIDVKIPKELYGLKAEIQVRTHLEHSWADFSHRIMYKRPFEMPDSWKREMARFAAMLEESDCHLIRIQKGLSHFLQDHSAYMTPEKMDSEIQILENVLKYDKDNVELAHEIARLAIERANWEKTIAVLQPYISKNEQDRKENKQFDKKKIAPILRDYGAALCNQFYKTRKDSGKQEYVRGQTKLNESRDMDPANIDTILALAATYRNFDEKKAERLYKEAFDLSPDDPQTLSYYLDYTVISTWDSSLAQSMKPVVKSAYIKSRDLTRAGLNIPWSYFNMGKFCLLCKKPHEAMRMYAKACQASRNAWPVHLALRSLTKLEPIESEIPAYIPIVRFLNLFLHVKYQEDSLEEKYKPSIFFKKSLKGPIVIVSGGTNKEIEEMLLKYGEYLITGFSDYRGTVISGGTYAGVCRLVGDVQEKYPGQIQTIGYLPAKIPSKEKIDSRYSKEPQLTEGSDFSSLETIQYWTDIIMSGIKPSDVKLIGINGGNISASEFRIAATLGAKVGIIADSGREASKIINDPDWNPVPNIIPLPTDPQTLRAFIRPLETIEDSSMRESLARLKHANYLEKRKKDMKGDDHAAELNDWDNLRMDFKESNYQQADDDFRKLRSIGYEIEKGEPGKIHNEDLSETEIEVLAEMEHGRYNIERLTDGWRLGPVKNNDKKLNPSLIPWDQLSKSAREYDKNAIRMIPENFAKCGYKIIKGKQGLK
jgi:ppGpp synthetase/RelA/SpoT-type nucleotidyltranferase